MERELENVQIVSTDHIESKYLDSLFRGKVSYFLQTIPVTLLFAVADVGEAGRIRDEFRNFRCVVRDELLHHARLAEICVLIHCDGWWVVMMGGLWVVGER